MKLITRYMTRNDCYQLAKAIVPCGIMVHSTATRGVMGPAWFDRWNKSYKAGETDRQVCVHAFVDNNGVYQYLPWTYKGWHSGSGTKGSAYSANNQGYIGFEMCEDRDWSPEYFKAVYANAVELCVMLCRQFGLNETNVITHCEGYRLGIASNHADVMHWFPQFGANMDKFRADVRSGLAATGAAPVIDTSKAVTHTVVRGESLSSIGKVYNVPWRDIAAINNIAGPLYVIHAGQVLTIRRVPDEPTIYIVQPGESLSVIGKRFGIGWQIIAADNGIVGPKYVIHAGDELVIRK